MAVIIFAMVTVFGSGFFSTEAQGSSNGSVIATVTINPLIINIRSSPRSPFVDKTFSLRSTIDNVGSDELQNVEAEIFLPSGLSITSNAKKFLDIVDGNRKTRVSWEILAESAGNHVIIVVVSAINSNSGQLISQEASTIVTIRTKPGNSIGAFLSFLSNLF